MAFFNFRFFPLSKFRISRVLSNFYYVRNIFELQICDNETATLFIFLKFARICTLFLYFFQNESNIATSLLMIHLKCTVVHYADLNSSTKNKPFLNYGSLNTLFCFFQFLIYVYFNETFVKKLMKYLSFFNTNFQNSFQDVVYYRILGYQTL